MKRIPAMKTDCAAAARAIIRGGNIRARRREDGGHDAAAATARRGRAPIGTPAGARRAHRPARRPRP
ncbi:hypothetical protein, partial [Burkholderia pseudomallei]|uniref:hypothetical protein n=1 Tax=Burkholderia pseudomallei TaxID=28450 RepID=UPI001C4DBD0F